MDSLVHLFDLENLMNPASHTIYWCLPSFHGHKYDLEFVDIRGKDYFTTLAPGRLDG